MKLSAVMMMVLLLVIGLTSFLFVRIEAGTGGSFLLAQRDAQRLTAAGVEHVVVTAPETEHGPRGRQATCVPLGHVGLRNPWHCLISYAGGARLGYSVQIHLDGSYVGSDQVIYRQGQVTHGNGQIRGCCIDVP